MTKDEFHNGLRILRSIDAHELGNPEWWSKFRSDPYMFFIRCADEEADAIWAVMANRAAPKREADRLASDDRHCREVFAENVKFGGMP